LIEELNNKGAKLAKYILTAKSEKNDEILFLLSADLIYREFNWWQSPEFGSNTWTESSPPPTDPFAKQRETNNTTKSAEEIAKDVTNGN